ncbi:hypothetical protein AAHA92_06759 [Salvia divinorum]|uniref:Uncharacterized protein n=1 Tax=Salvia divinorum TaxID=28513 RepID=A0ABD1I6U0_SALDI
MLGLINFVSQWDLNDNSVFTFSSHYRDDSSLIDSSFQLSLGCCCFLIVFSHGDSGSNTTRRTSRKRSNMNHRPSNESESPQENRDSISLSSTPSDHCIRFMTKTTHWRNPLTLKVVLTIILLQLA